jgi:hypothetical protein
MAVASKTRGVSKLETPFMAHNIFQMYLGIEVPDPITFVVGDKWLNRPNLYPRQATLLKIIFLRDDLFTEYDLTVIEEWETEYRTTGNSGIVPNIMWRIKWLKARGYKWFREVLLVMGRRAGKGHITALAMAYVLWNYMAKGDPQGFYGVDRDKRLTLLVFAGKRDQAKATVFGDLNNVVTGSVCFTPFLSEIHTERVSIYAPHDFVRMQKMAERGLRSERDMATFEILPKESTMMAGRGSTSFAQAYDEWAHILGTAGGKKGGADVYQAAKPSLDQFGKDAFIVEPSSPWQMLGQFYDNYCEAIGLDADGLPSRPNFLMIQLASWGIYLDWERAGLMDLFPSDFLGDLGEYADRYEPLKFQPLRGAIQVFDDEMRREKAANPETFAVEREAHWATVLDAYLNEDKVDAIFAPWMERPGKYGPPEITQQSQGLLVHTYKGHADPSKVNDKFGYALAHSEYDEDGKAHCVFDILGHFDPADYPDHIIDYEEVDDWIWHSIILKFYPEEWTYDQYNSVASIQKLQKRIRGASMPKHVNVFEKTATRPYDWKVKENSKAAINLGLVHAPPNERAQLELRFLQLVNGRVDHPSSGPVQSKDIADSMTECIHVLIGEQTQNFLHSDLNGLRPGMNSMGEPFPGMTQGNESDRETLNALSGFSRGRGNMERSPSRTRRRQY